MGRKIRKVLIANRGEIAVRIARTLREMNIASVAAYSVADRGALHVRAADEAVELGPAPAAQSYLDIGRLMKAARDTGADALHPGYGFVAESPDLAEACAASGVIFIGPPPEAMRRMALKLDAREAMQAAGVPVTPGGTATDLDDAKATAERLGYPVLLKPSAGGGGKGMRRVDGAGELPGAWARARSEAKNAFGDDTIYVEKLLVAPRHVEVQLLGDQHGNVIHLFERDCSIQRRHQKLIEESPCTVLSDEEARRIGEIAARGAAAIGYHSAGTMEFMLASDGQIYFLEMNTRLQVEHPVTEMCTGLDLVAEMIRIAEGDELSLKEPPERRGHAIECRIYAEDPSQGFLPSPGRIDDMVLPSGPGVRNDEGADRGQVIAPDYDPLLAKLIVHAPDRGRALARMKRALDEYRVLGIATNIGCLRQIIDAPAFRSGAFHTQFLDNELPDLLARAPANEHSVATLAAALVALEHERSKRKPREDEGSAMPSPWVIRHRRSALGSTR